MDLETTRKKLQLIEKTADILFQKAHTESDCPDLSDPLIWLLNQNEMRLSWQLYNEELNNTKFKSKMLDTPFSKYMQFMYNTYPPGFGDILNKKYETTEKVDTAQIYHDLIYKS